MKVSVDQDLCTGCEDCVNNTPDIFELNDDGLAVAKVSDVPADKEEEVKQAAEDCPAAAIEVE